MKEYKDCYVAFLDILGFKNIVKEQDCDYIYETMNKLHDLTKHSLNFNGFDIMAYEKIKHIILSDSIVVYIESDIEDAFVALMHVCYLLQQHLASLEYPIFLRGGITKGPLCFDDTIIFGNALTQAYLLENNIAVYPRIIFTGNILDEGRKNAKYLFPEIDGLGVMYKIDKDELYYIDYFDRGIHDVDDYKQYYDNILSFCETILDSETNQRIRDKYIWIKNMVRKRIESDSSLKREYDEEERKMRDKKHNEYHEKFKIFGDNVPKIELVGITVTKEQNDDKVND